MARIDKFAVRRRIIKAMPRGLLDDQFSQDERPWGSDRVNIEERTLHRWTDDMRETFLEWLRNHS